MKPAILTILLACISCITNVHAQTFHVNLSPKHVSKINSAKSGYERLKKYRKFYSRDSTKHLRTLNKQLRRKSDSITRSVVRSRKLEDEMGRKGLRLPTDTVALLRHYASLVQKDTTSTDSTTLSRLKTLGADSKQIQELKKKYAFNNEDVLAWKSADSTSRKGLERQALKRAREKAIASMPTAQRKQLEALESQYGPYSKEIVGYVGFLKDSVDVADTLRSIAAQRLEQAATQAASNAIGGGNLSEMKNADGKLKEISDMPGDYMQKGKDMTNPDALKDLAQQKVMDKVTGQADKLKPAMSKLKGIYSSMPNSNDLSQAIKAKSLEGRPFREHWVIGGNFNIASTAPIMVDLSPQIGYRIDRKLQIGIGGIYRAKFVDSVKVANAISPVHYGHSVFLNYGLILNFFSYAEWERTAAIVKTSSSDHSIQWVNSLLVGVGRTFKITSKVNGNILLLYNPLHENGTTPYHDAFVIKTGFHLSELAMIKR